MKRRHCAQIVVAALITSVVSVVPATANAKGDNTMRVDITGGRKAHLRGGKLKCILKDDPMLPDFYSVKVHAWGRGGGFGAHGPSKEIPGAYKAVKAGVNVSYKNVELAGVDGRGGHVTASKDGTRITFNVALHRTDRGKPITARARGTLTCRS